MITIHYAGVTLQVQPLIEPIEDPYNWRVLVAGVAIVRSIEELYTILRGGTVS